ncbi:MAG TPA: hypothetical protein VFG10_09745 [Saprospiraceae bacterium]|nr:hypothetical protein [Saprospiraceae bacterium]
MNKIPRIRNAASMGQILEFEVVFSGEEKLSFEQYLAGGSRTVILNAAALFLGFRNHNSQFADNRKFLGRFFHKDNADFANYVYDKIYTIEKTGIRVSIVKAYSSLKLFEYYFSKPEEEVTQSQPEFEVNLFKAYLVLNSEYLQNQSAAFPSISELDDELYLPMMLFCMHYPVYDKSNYDIYQMAVTQMIKSIHLFQFLETHQKTQPLLLAFLAYFNCSTWQEYLKSLLPLTTAAIRSDREAHTDIVVEAGENFENGCAFIEKLMLQENEELDQNDFLTTRAKPFYKISEGVYRIIFNLFVVEKVFKGVYFQLRDVNKTLPNDQKEKDIRSFYGKEFSEKILSYKVIEGIYSPNYIRFSGQELEDRKIDGSPDYYIRKGNNIVIFESKDFLIAAAKKMSFDFSIYEEEFQKVLYYEDLAKGKVKQKAVLQLINSIRSLLTDNFSADKDYHAKHIFIYPVLLTHDHQYDAPGFNELLNYWFQDELKGLQGEGVFTKHVQPLSVVNIDSLIFNQIGLANDIPLHETLRLYHENKKVIKRKRKFKSREEQEQFIEEYKQMRMDTLIPFSLFLDKHFDQLGLYERPPLLEVVGPALYKEEFEKREAAKEN